jgi:uncharacterized membrane protein
VTYYIRIENDGNAAETFSITATAGNSDWIVSYYDVSTGTDITDLVKNGLYSWGPVAPILSGGDYLTIRLEVKPITTAIGAEYTTFVTAISKQSGWVTKDVRPPIGGSNRMTLERKGPNGFAPARARLVMA